jgi:hypothetical protein
VEGASLSGGKFLNLAPGSYVVKALAADGRGNADGCSKVTNAVVLSEPDKLVCEITSSAPVLCGNPYSGTATVSVSGGTGSYTIVWSNGETGATAVSLPAGLQTVTITDEHGCTTSCEVNIGILPCDIKLCFYTQGFYGSQGGTKCSAGGLVTAYDIMFKVVDSQADKKVVFGKNSKSFTLYLSDIVNKSIFNMMPGGSTPAALKGTATYSNTSTWSYVPLSTKSFSYGKIQNNLLSQTMAFFFNLGWNSKAPGVEIKGNRLVTIKATDCGGAPIQDAKPDTFAIPSDVITFMAANGYGNTLQGLLNLANDVLGGLTGVSPSSVTGALDAFNRGFDDCSMLVEFYNSPLKKAAISIIDAPIYKNGEISAYPNPFTDKVSFEFKTVKDGLARLEIFDARGTKLHTLFDNRVSANQTYKMDYYPKDTFTGLILYRLSIDGDVINGKLIRKE